MIPEEIKWEIEIVKKRFDSDYQIVISDDQAEAIYNQEKDHGSIIHYFSIWDQLDYKLSYLDGILDSDQLKRLIEIEKECVKGYEDRLVEQDKVIVNQLTVASEKLSYYREHLLPKIFGDYTLVLGGFEMERPKINYLKAEYKNYLDRGKKEIYLSHFKNNRKFQPNFLRFYLLNHQLNYLFPDYYLFKQSMDEPTKNINNYLREKLKGFSYRIDEKMKAILEELSLFNATLVNKHMGEIAGWHTDLIVSAEEEKEYRLMCLLLVDRNHYGC